jgi:hypothetical protein
MTSDSLIPVQTHNVKWDISHVPKQITNSDGFRIQLRFDDLISPRSSRQSHSYVVLAN